MSQRIGLEFYQPTYNFCRPRYERFRTIMGLIFAFCLKKLLDHCAQSHFGWKSLNISVIVDYTNTLSTEQRLELRVEGKEDYPSV